MKRSLLVVALTLSAPLAAVQQVASASTPSTKGGPIHIYEVTPNGSQTSTVVVTGAVADVGTDTAIDGGNESRLVLKHGTVVTNGSALNMKLASAVPTIDSVTCGATLTVSGNVTVLSGTGAYKGITGTIRLVFSTAAVLPKLANGKCNEGGNTAPIGAVDWILGSGTVSFGR